MDLVSKMHSVLILWPVLFLLVCTKNVLSLPIADLTDNERHTATKLPETPSSGSNEYYELLSLQPTVVKMAAKEDFKPENSKINEVLHETPQQTDFWTSIKLFFTNDVNNFMKTVADKYNPMPSIAHALDNAKRSNTWSAISSFFTLNYDRNVCKSGLEKKNNILNGK